LVAADSPNDSCQACELNAEIDEAARASIEDWRATEQAKRRLIYGLNRLGLPLTAKRRDPERGLAFALRVPSEGRPVLTGHDAGTITLNLAEANPAERERVRVAMHEPYRTLLGHFRHEVGHYYWYLLVDNREPLAGFRAQFGDESVDYAEALAAHYAKGEVAHDSERFITHYASAHPWEDFAECFAHYLHSFDTLETAAQFGFLEDRAALADGEQRFEALMSEWYRLSVALNSLNRSMGIQDPYPFVVAPAVKEKLRFIDQLIQSARPPAVSGVGAGGVVAEAAAGAGLVAAATARQVVADDAPLGVHALPVPAEPAGGGAVLDHHGPL
jgi:hypothetical protein